MATNPSPSNVLLLIADDWSPIANCYGNPVIQTPNIDALAARGTVFDHAFCTTPSCAASRANILTGQYSHRHGQYGHCHSIHGFRTHEEFADRSLPAILGKNGVFSGLVGKRHIAPQHVYPFDYRGEGRPWFTEELRQSVRRFYETAGDRPFYLHAASMYPHRTAPGAGFNPETGDGEEPERDVVYAPEDVIVPPWLPDCPETRRDLADYYRFVTRFDRFVGAMLEELERAGHAGDTTVILMSDHGMPFPGAKASFYESGHHCPLIVAPPAGTPRHNRALVNWCDIFPTVTDALGLPPEARPPDLPGRSLVPILEEDDPEGWDRTYYSHTFHGINEYYPYRVVRERKLKFVQFLAHPLPHPLPIDLYDSPTWRHARETKPTFLGQRPATGFLYHDAEELYDLERDPAETTNRANDPEYAAEAARLRELLLKMREETGDPLVTDQPPLFPDPRRKEDGVR